MNKLIIVIVLLSFSTLASSSTDIMFGTWEAFSRSSQAIYGSIDFSAKSIEWGIKTENGERVFNKGYPCKSKYTVLYNENEKVYFYKLTNKSCDYNNMKNAHVHKKLTGFRISIIKNTMWKQEAKFVSLTEEYKSSGTGVFYKPVPRK